MQYFTDKTSTIHSLDTGFIYAVFKLSLSKQHKIECLNPLCCRLTVNSMKTSFAHQSIFTTLSANPMK